MSNINYKKIFAMKKKLQERIINICPNMQDTSGIYTFHKIDENGFKKYYSGQAKHLVQRCANHLNEYDHIALSLKKYGFKKEGNPYGWELEYFYCPDDQLDIKEQETIAHWHKDLGYIPYNKTSGGQNSKFGITDNKPPKGYRDGIAYGKKKIARDLTTIIDKYLIVSAKDTSKRSQNALEKFWSLLNFDENAEN